MPKTVSEVSGCNGCPMQRLYPDNTFVSPQFPSLDKDLVRILIAEAPGEEESKLGTPLVGGSGRLLNKLLYKAGVAREGLTITNCLQCRPPNNIFPTDPAGRSYISKAEAEQAVQHCKNAHVAPLLSSRKWKRVDLLGDKPLRIIAGVTSGIGTMRGSPLQFDGLRGIATYHPSYLMRDQVFLPVAVNDLKKSLEEPPEYYTPYPTIEDVRKFKFTTFAFDIECPKYRTLGESAPVELVGLCGQSGYAMCVPVRGEYTSELKRIFLAAEGLVGHNCLQFDLPKLREIGIKTKSNVVVHDTMLQQHLLFPDLPHDLEFVASQFISKPAWKADKTKGWEPYCCRDTDATLQVWHHLYPMLKREKLESLYFNVQVPMAKICLLMHETGFKVDTSRIKEVRVKLLEEMQREERNLPEFLRTCSKPVNKRSPAPPGTLGKSGRPVKYITVPTSEEVIPWRSTAVKQKYLYGSVESGGLGLEPILDPKSGNVTTGKIAIAKIYARTKNDAVRALGVLNKLDETITTFAKEDMVKISRMYPHFNVHGTASGRLSSSDPNLQNIPEAARCIYVPSHQGWKIIDVDYSQIENRLTAYFAGDQARLSRFLQDKNFSEHKYAASLFLNIPYDEVEKDNDKDAPYGKAKRIVHGTNYGMGYKKISNLYDMDLADTRRLQDTWKAAIQPTISWQNRCGMEAKEKGFLTTPFGRKRWFWTSSYYTESLSFLPQSTAADVIFRSMIGLLFERIGLSESQAKLVCPRVESLPTPARILLQVHDSLIFECPGSQVDELIAVVTRVMTQPWPELKGMSIPIGVKVGDSWGESE